MIVVSRIGDNLFILSYVFSLESNSDEENLPSLETLDIGKKKSNIQSINSYFGGEEEENIPDMAEYEEPDNLIETDPVSFYFDNCF